MSEENTSPSDFPRELPIFYYTFIESSKTIQFYKLDTRRGRVPVKILPTDEPSPKHDEPNIVKIARLQRLEVECFDRDFEEWNELLNERTIKEVDSMGRTAIHWAAFNGDYKGLALLLKVPNARDILMLTDNGGRRPIDLVKCNSVYPKDYDRNHPIGYMGPKEKRSYFTTRLIIENAVNRRQAISRY